MLNSVRLSIYYLKIFMYIYFNILFLPIRLFFRRPIRAPDRTVFVMGTFCHTPDEFPLLPYWGAINSEEIISPKLGKVSSIHDRACELFYQLKGLDIDYGYYHSQQCKHQQIILNSNKMSIPWTENEPLNFICHSAGGLTISYLLYLLHINYFNMNTSAKWVKSITFISVPHKGIPYLDKIGMIKKEISIFSRIYFASRIVLLYNYIVKRSKIIKYQYNLDHHTINSFDNDNLILDLHHERSIKITQNAKEIANKYKIPILNVVCQNSEKVNEGYYGSIGMSVVSFMFLLVSGTKNLTSHHDGIVTVDSQAYWNLNNISDNNKQLKINCDHIDPIGTFGLTPRIRNLYSFVFDFIKNS